MKAFGVEVEVPAGAFCCLLGSAGCDCVLTTSRKLDEVLTLRDLSLRFHTHKRYLGMRRTA